MTGPQIIPDPNPVVDVHATGAGRLSAICEVPGCDWISTGHRARAVAEERAGHHRSDHRRAAQEQQS